MVSWGTGREAAVVVVLVILTVVRIYVFLVLVSRVCVCVCVCVWRSYFCWAADVMVVVVVKNNEEEEVLIAAAAEVVVAVVVVVVVAVVNPATPFSHDNTTSCPAMHTVVYLNMLSVRLGKTTAFRPVPYIPSRGHPCIVPAASLPSVYVQNKCIIIIIINHIPFTAGMLQGRRLNTLKKKNTSNLREAFTS